MLITDLGLFVRLNISSILIVTAIGVVSSLNTTVACCAEPLPRMIAPEFLLVSMPSLSCKTPCLKLIPLSMAFLFLSTLANKLSDTPKPDKWLLLLFASPSSTLIPSNKVLPKITLISGLPKSAPIMLELFPKKAVEIFCKKVSKKASIFSLSLASLEALPVSNTISSERTSLKTLVVNASLL